MKKAFDKVLIVMFENQYRSYVMQDAYMEKLASAGCNMTNYFGAFHPSQTNYLASISGEVCGVTDDTPPASPLMQETITNLMQPPNGIQKATWKAYMEAYPNEPWNKAWETPNYPPSEEPITEYPNDGINLFRYARKHNPFSSYYDIQSSEEKWSNIQDEYAFWKDVYGHTLPEYAWFTPDIWNDGHYLYNTGIAPNPRLPLVTQLSAWLEQVFLGHPDTSRVQGGTKFGLDKIGLNLDLDLVMTDPKKAYAQSNIPEGTLVVITFDEADYDAEGYDTNYDGPNQIYTVLLGDMITPGSSIETPYNHYSLLHTIEKNFDLGSLNKNDKDANWFRFLWGESFDWSSPLDTGITVNNGLSTFWFSNQFNMIYRDASNQLVWSAFTGSDWVKGEIIDFKVDHNFTVESLDDELLLVFTQGSTNVLCYSIYTQENGWSDVQSLGQYQVGYLDTTVFEDYASNTKQIMLAWQKTESQEIYSLKYAEGQWENSPVSVGQYTDGPITASALGASVYLVYKERNTFNMRITSYNTAPFNALQPELSEGVNNHTTLHQWSPMDFHVGHFSKKENQKQDVYLANGNLAMASIQGEMHLVYRGRYNDTPSAITTCFGLTGIYTAESELTNGYGTLNQAGWTLEEKHQDMVLDPSSCLSMAANGSTFMMVYQKQNTNALYYVIGQYASPTNNVEDTVIHREVSYS